MPQLHTASSERYTLHHSLPRMVPLPSAEGGKRWRQSRHNELRWRVSSKCTFPQTIQLVAWRFRVCGREAGAFRSPPPPLRPPPYKLISYLASAGRGGSVSRRDHDYPHRKLLPSRMGAQAQRNAQPYSQLLFGRGARGRRFSSRSGLPRVCSTPPPQVAAALSAAVTTTT